MVSFVLGVNVWSLKKMFKAATPAICCSNFCLGESPYWTPHVYGYLVRYDLIAKPSSHACARIATWYISQLDSSSSRLLTRARGLQLVV